MKLIIKSIILDLMMRILKWLIWREVIKANINDWLGWGLKLFSFKQLKYLKFRWYNAWVKILIFSLTFD